MLALDLGPIDSEENSIPTKPLNPESVKLPEGEDDISPSFEKVSVKNMQDIFEGISKSSVSTKAMLKPESSVEQSSDSHTTVRQITKHQDSAAEDSSDCEISSLHERQKSMTSSSESEVCNVLKRSGTDSSDYEIHSTIYLQKGNDSFSPEKPTDDQTNAMLLSTEDMEQPELSPKEKATFEAFVKPSMDESEDLVESFEHKPMPLKKQLQKINSTDLLHRQIKEDMYEQVMSQEDDSVMSESTIENNIFQQNSEFADSMNKMEEKFLDSAISLGRTPSSNDALEYDSLADYDVPLPLKTDSDSSISVQQAVENEIEEPEWELVEAEEAEKRRKESNEQMSKRSMTPEQALEVATEIVQNVQTEAIKKYEELIKTNQLPKPQPDSKFTPETKEKVQEYLKELEESEQYDVVAAELINKVVSKKEERLKHLKHQDISVDITDDDEHKSESMLNDMRNELRRNSISVTDEDLTTELTHELLQEKNIEEMKKHLEDSQVKFEHISTISSDYRFQTSFRSHYVRANEDRVITPESTIAKNQESEDIWAEESKVIFRRDLKTMKDKKSDNDSNSSGSKQNLRNICDRRSGTDQEGYSSAGETYFSTVEHLTSGTASGQSRPTSSDMDAMLSAVSERSTTTTEHTEFLTAQDHSSLHDNSSADTSHYYTAGSSLSSHASVKSSESSGHLGSIEISECSETLVESSLEYEPRIDDGSETPAGIKQLDEVSVEEFEVVGSTSHKMYSLESSSSTEQSRHSVEYITARRNTHMRNSSSSSIQTFDISPQEMQCLAEDDVDGCCFSTEKDEDLEEKESLLPDHRFPIPDVLASRFSESRETLSSSVLTLSSVSEATIIGQDHGALTASQLSLNPFMDPIQKTTDLLTGSITTLTSGTNSSWSTHVIPPIPPKENSETTYALENLLEDELDEQDQLFPMPRMRSIEGTHSVQVPFPQQMSVDFGSEYDSRPNSELKDVESRPLSTDRMSRTSSSEALHGMMDKRSCSIDETVSDCLRVNEPFIRPKSPMPQNSIGSDTSRHSSNSNDQKLRISFSAPIRAVSPVPVPPRQCLQSTESFETEIAFSKHFTQVFDDIEFESNEINKTNDTKTYSTVSENLDLTPESQLTSDSIETSQGEEYIIHPENKLASPKPNFDLEDQDDLLVGSPPMVSRPLGVKYWPPVDNLDQDLDALGPMDKRSITRSESDDNSESRLDIDNDMIEKEVEDGKRWLESQFDGTQQDEYGQFGYGQPLDQILEEEEDRYSHSSEDVKELQRFKESLSSTPDFDQIINKRHQVPRSGDQDDISMGSLTEFERLEREVGLESVSGSGSHGSLGSNDSLEVYSNGNSNEKIEKNGSVKTNLAVKILNQSKSGTGDDVSVSSYNSVRSFEMMEAACKEAEQIEIKAKQQEEVLSEIEEGHESQDSESAETISECDEEKSEKDYEDRLFEIDSIIKQAQANVEKFDKDKKPADEISLRDIMGRPDSRTESITSNDSLDCTKLPDLPKEETHLRRQSSMPTSLPTRIQFGQASRTTSATSLQSMTSVTSIASVSTLTQFDADSIREREMDLDDLDEAADLMQASVDSLEQRGKSPENTMITSTDSLEGTQKKQDNMTISTDSIENSSNNEKKDMMTVSLDSLDGIVNKDGTMERKSDLLHDCDGATSILITSTDSLESSSTNTRATASMLSSMTSQGSETLVADDEFEHDDEDSRSVRKFLIDQGNLQLDDSDDSATYSYSSPQMQHKVFHKDLSDVTVTKFQIKDGRFGSLENFGSSEEILETEEVDEKGNIIVKKVIQKRIFQEPRKMRVTDRKQEGYLSDLSEKRDDSCEETIEEIDEFGKRRKYVVKRTIEQPKPETLGIIHERRQQKGLSPIGEIFKSVTDTPQPQQSKLEAKRKQPIHHTERITKSFDAPPSTPSPPASPPSSSFRSQIPIRKH